jgi:hypothetical protein
MRLWFQRRVAAIVNAKAGANKAAVGFCQARPLSFQDGPKDQTRNLEIPDRDSSGAQLRT